MILQTDNLGSSAAIEKDSCLLNCFANERRRGVSCLLRSAPPIIMCREDGGRAIRADLFRKWLDTELELNDDSNSECRTHVHEYDNFDNVVHFSCWRRRMAGERFEQHFCLVPRRQLGQLSQTAMAVRESRIGPGCQARLKMTVSP